MLSLFPMNSDLCCLVTNLGRRECVFCLWLFCPSLHVFLLNAVFQQATSVPDKARSQHYLTRKALQTLKVDKTENEKLSSCLFPVTISGLQPINISVQLSQKETMWGKEGGRNSWLRHFVDLVQTENTLPRLRFQHNI